ncbi:MAG UNVERIFIED_CONTAM: hypothetical protein LVQ98_01340 [Rickettsiaceae bacterium]
MSYRYINIKRMNEEKFKKTLGISRENFTMLLRILYKYNSNDFKSRNFKLTIIERLALALEYLIDPLSSIHIGKPYGLRKEGVWYSVRWVWRHLGMDLNILAYIKTQDVPIDDFLSETNYLSIITKEDSEKEIGFTEGRFKNLLKLFIAAFKTTSKEEIYHIYAKKIDNKIPPQPIEVKNNNIDISNKFDSNNYDSKFIQADYISNLYGIKYRNIEIKIENLQDEYDYKIAFGLSKAMFYEILAMIHVQTRPRKITKEKALIMALESFKWNLSDKDLEAKYYISEIDIKRYITQIRKDISLNEKFAPILLPNFTPLIEDQVSDAKIFVEKGKLERMLTIVSNMSRLRKCYTITLKDRVLILLKYIILHKSHQELAKEYNISASSVQHIIRNLNKEFMRYPELKYPGLWLHNRDQKEYAWKVHIFQHEALIIR